ncbi:ATP-binding protein [Paraburkholderia sp. NMBU_R16]|uniref:ATP-binding protein n=1 Tax=Paraburkholderia sp. NMBU_R16 TaxID=2698676 RepID=UPI001C27FA47|nr:ATP-binding protein [Paraburkholderia sp. NMBU_R16]
MRPWPRTLLGRNMLLLIALIVGSQVSTVGVFVLFVQFPRVDDAAAVEATQIALIEHILSSMPEPQRSRMVSELHGLPERALPPDAKHDSAPSSYVTRRFFNRITRELPPGVKVRWSESHGHRIWVRLPMDDGFRWIMLQGAPGMDRGMPWSVVWTLLTIAMFPALGAYLIHRRIAGPLDRLARAATSVERGVWPEPVPVVGPLELSTVTETFNRMVASLAEAEAVRAQMLAGISHDIRTPLTKLRMALGAPETLDAPIATAERFVEEINVIIQQFIDFARGGESEAPTAGNLNALIRQLAADYAGLGYPFELYLQNLPQFKFRPVSIQRLLMNLMQNGAVYGRVGLSVETRCEGGFIVISVADRGPGVSAEMLPLITQPFRRGTNAAEKGTGLGLAIAERIARHHGGSLEVRMRDGGGLIVEARLRAS